MITSFESISLLRSSKKILFLCRSWSITSNSFWGSNFDNVTTFCNDYVYKIIYHLINNEIFYSIIYYFVFFNTWFCCFNTWFCWKVKTVFIFLFFLFMQNHIYNGHINKIKISKTEMHITVIRCKATLTPEIKLKENKLQN